MPKSKRFSGGNAMKYKKILYGILLVSLALNLFFAGVFTTFVLRPGPLKPFGSNEMFNFEAARGAIDPEFQPVVDEIWGDFKMGRRSMFRNIFRFRRDTQQILTADQFDAEAFEDLSLRIFSATEGMRTAMQSVIVDLATSLPDAERKKYFKAGFDRTNIERPRRRLGRDDDDRD